jgi:hypothetical protein
VEEPTQHFIMLTASIRKEIILMSKGTAMVKQSSSTEGGASLKPEGLIGVAPLNRWPSLTEGIETASREKASLVKALAHAKRSALTEDTTATGHRDLDE